jgi:GT2 family glycosyltransferase/2-polyprenyl-3-methyl-5-hydroxy-6-metoxy-1,4-benzoquinol methylase/glycosyltransferase involved in cell wall biosynthesis
MVDPTPALHVYDREIDSSQRSSLSVLSAHIAPGARVLDLGCGSGAIGRFLAARDGAGATPIDGLTLNADEAALAAPHYRRVEVANLDDCDLVALFGTGQYDVIVCADVLEHVRGSERVLAQCARLLAPGGRALLSIPNAGYAGLIAELMAGEFRYRPEGLLDETHVRFFTRRALLRFLRDGDWLAEQVETVQRALPDSEFRVAFDALPPAVARHLLALPDALTYQFIVIARPRQADEPPMTLPPAEAALPEQALFTSQLYLAHGGGFDEQRKLTTAGVIGQARQSLRFALPTEAPLTGLKLDPADRPGYLYLHALTLQAADGRALWHWTAADAATLATARMAGVVAQPPALPSDAFLLLLHGDDPWIELPIPAEALAQASGGALQVELGWPMSADYLVLASTAEQRARHVADARADAARAQRELAAQTAQADTERELRQRLEQQAQHLRAEKQTLLLRSHELSRERDEARQLVHDIENSTVFRATRPIVHAKMRLDRLLGTGSARPAAAERPAPQPLTPPPQPVDIIVPVYKGLADTRRCLESVLAARCATPWRLIVINDASPEPEVTDWLRAFAPGDERVTLLENPENLGFVGTVNRGMALSGEHDVLLLNSDTEVANDWLDRIRAAAYGDQKVASVTPFSNNATICSYPRFCEDNELPAGWDTARLDALFARTNAGQVVDVPTGVGFCMYIRRAALAEVGLFDVEHFGKGYGEENDFCIRAAAAGWRNLHALDTFVRHFGGVSFGASKSPRERAAMQTLRRLHPRYEAEVLRFVAADPARPARSAADLARLLDGQQPLILAVLHDRGGGTERHAVELAELLQPQARFLLLRPLPGQRVGLRLPGAHEGFELAFELPAQGEALLTLLRGLGVRHLHFHHLLGHGEFVRRLPARLGVSHDFTAHDFHFADPGITLTDPSGHYDPARDPAHPEAAAPDADLMAWRQQNAELLNAARFVIAPSRDMLARLIPLVPGAPLRLVPHTDIDPAQPLPQPAPPRLQGARPLRVAVVGALSAIKGADVLEDVALAARRQGVPVEFHLLGYAYRNLRTQPHAQLTVYGRYDEQDLPGLLRWLQPDLVWFPAQWPETYSYTLSACLLGGWPVVAPDLGAFAERLSGRAWSWVRPWRQSAAEWLAFFVDVRERHFATGDGPPPVPADDARLGATRGVEPQPSAAWYASTYLDGLPAAGDAGALPADTWQPYLPAPDQGLASGAKGRLLHALVRLRALPVLAPLARAIPLRWQTRVKNWLRG